VVESLFDFVQSVLPCLFLPGIVEEDEFTIEQPIGKTSKSGNMKFSDYNWVAMDSGKPSHSEFRVIFRNLEKKITLVCPKHEGKRRKEEAKGRNRREVDKRKRKKEKRRKEEG
jgi:hypothetical protein